MTTNDDGEPLFEAVRSALSRRTPDLDEAGIRRRVLVAHAAGQRPDRARAQRRWAVAGVALAALAVVLVALSWPRSTTFQVAGQNGEVGRALEARPAEPLTLVFSEGTRVLLGAGSRGRVGELTPHGARVELERGSVSADVVHRAQTAWTFIAGPFRVAVLGTQLEVAWAPQTQQFELRVARGVVRVSGPLLPVGQELRAGQACRIDLARNRIELGRSPSAEPNGAPVQPGASPSAPPEPANLVEGAPSAVGSAPAPAASVEPPKAAWLALVQAGKPVEGVTAAERVGLPGIYRGSSAEALLELARAARLSGRPDIERTALLACRRRASGQLAAAQAAYLLGRASAPSEAASWFETYIREQPRGLLAREAAGRLVESYAAAGNRSAAAQAATRYLAAYPDGPHASMAHQLLGRDARP